MTNTIVRKVIEAPGFLAILEVPAILTKELPREPLLDAKTVKLLATAREKAAAGDKEWLIQHGAKLYTGIFA